MENLDKTDPPNPAPRTRLVRVRAMLAAQNRYESAFISDCERHGAAICDTPTGACLLCLHTHANLPEALAVKLAGGIYFFKDCVDCGGPRKHHVESHRCASCFDSSGRDRRQAPLSDRAEARAARRRFYGEQCSTCAEATDHWVTTGKCARCFTAAGKGRVQGSRSLGARAVARAAGKASYRSVCGVHGEADHGVRYGKCLVCFTADGHPRRGPVLTERTEARKRGVKFYTADCPEHGPAPFYTSRGLCSHCFNGAGDKRRRLI